MLKLPLAFFCVFSLLSGASIAAAEGAGVAEDAQSDDAPADVLITGGWVFWTHSGPTLAAEGRPVGQLYLGGMVTLAGNGHEGLIFGGPRVSYRFEVDRFALAPLVAVGVVVGGALSQDGVDRRSASTPTVLGGGQLSAHFGPVLVGVEATVMPLPVTVENDDQPDRKRTDVFGTVAVIGGARF